MLGNEREYRVLRVLLRGMREEAGLRQQDLADRLGRPQSFVSKVEIGERRLDLIELRVICREFGVSLGELVDRFEKRLQD